jgi:hypothetical protein
MIELLNSLFQFAAVYADMQIADAHFQEVIVREIFPRKLHLQASYRGSPPGMANAQPSTLCVRMLSQPELERGRCLVG